MHFQLFFTEAEINKNTKYLGFESKFCLSDKDNICERNEQSTCVSELPLQLGSSGCCELPVGS